MKIDGTALSSTGHGPVSHRFRACTTSWCIRLAHAACSLSLHRKGGQGARPTAHSAGRAPSFSAHMPGTNAGSQLILVAKGLDCEP